MDDSLLGHLVALRRAILRAAAGVALLLVPGFLAAPAAIRALVRLAVPERIGQLHYFAPLEAFRAQLHVGFVLATAAAWPWIAAQVWGFLRPGLLRDEARALRRWIPLSTLLFLGGVLFACAAVMPLVMAFSASFEAPGLAPLIGLGAFLHLAGSLALGFGRRRPSCSPSPRGSGSRRPTDSAAGGRGPSSPSSRSRRSSRRPTSRARCCSPSPPCSSTSSGSCSRRALPQDHDGPVELRDPSGLGADPVGVRAVVRPGVSRADPVAVAQRGTAEVGRLELRRDEEGRG